jgi:translocation protein SEC72
MPVYLNVSLAASVMAATPSQLQHPMQAQIQQQLLPRPDPVMQAAIEADFRSVDLALDSTNVSVICAPHSREKCDECDADYTHLNRLSKVLTANPNFLCPPPPNVVNQKLSQIVNQTKEEGNVRVSSVHRNHF